MTYNQIRAAIKTGDLIAWSEGGSWTSWRNIQLNLIRMGTMSDWNHVGIAYVADGRVFVVEAVIPEVRIYPLSKLLPFTFIHTPFMFDDIATDRMLKWVGTKYSKWEAIKAPFTRQTNNDKAMQCAKLCNDVYSYFNSDYSNLHDTPAAVVKFTLDNYMTESVNVIS